MEGLLPAPFKVLSKPDVSATSLATEHIEPKDVTYVASYNWTEDLNPTIIVPGETLIQRHFDDDVNDAILLQEHRRHGRVQLLPSRSSRTEGLDS